ncbi:MAG: hypothetical protein ABFE07_28620 [Armatimonadia bacterium]
MKLLAGKRVALVGNGPSGTDQGKVIDTFDFVVRVSRWVSQGPTYAGFKVSAIAGCDSHIETPYQIHAARDWEIWCNEPPKDILAEPAFDRPADWRRLFAIADGRAIRTVRNCIHEELTVALRNISLFRKHPPRADIGSVAVAMALDMGATRLHLWGYDRTGYGQANDNWAQQPLQDPKDQCNHDYRARAHLLADLVDHHRWCGRDVEIAEIEWHGRPPMPQLVPDPDIPEQP